MISFRHGVETRRRGCKAASKAITVPSLRNASKKEPEGCHDTLSTACRNYTVRNTSIVTETRDFYIYKCHEVNQHLDD